MNYIKTTFSTLSAIILLTACNNPQTQQATEQQQDTVVREATPTEKKQNIVFFGNSLTAGLGLENQTEAFPALIQQKIDSLGLNYTCINAGLSGETSAGGKDRIDWLLKEPIDVFVLELGANDGLRGIKPEATKKNLGEIVDKVIKAYPNCKLVLAGMKVPPSMGEAYFKEFEAIFPALAQEKNMTLVPFLLDNVAGITKLNQQDAVHPTKEGQLILAENVWKHLKGIL
ncbi:arylesterase [Sphingobacterium hotanense]|uniref:arylesterase n=1 Tax=Sphingobacterium hotanense TaxID=649196 RepID=UPI0011F2EA2C|nr:arylesterase [Sphingobacterium hotanense]